MKAAVKIESGLTNMTSFDSSDYDIDDDDDEVYLLTTNGGNVSLFVNDAIASTATEDTDKNVAISPQVVDNGSTITSSKRTPRKAKVLGRRPTTSIRTLVRWGLVVVLIASELVLAFLTLQHYMTQYAASSSSSAATTRHHDSPTTTHSTTPNVLYTMDWRRAGISPLSVYASRTHKILGQKR